LQKLTQSRTLSNFLFDHTRTLRPEGRIVSTIVHHGELADVLGTVDRTPPTVAAAGPALDVQ
jgi:hypothetical protein